MWFELVVIISLRCQTRVEAELIREIGRRTTTITGEAKHTVYMHLFQQLSVPLQRGIAVSFQSMFTASYNKLQYYLFLPMSKSVGIKYKGIKIVVSLVVVVVVVVAAAAAAAAAIQ